MNFRINTTYPDRLDFYINGVEVFNADYDEDGSNVVEAAKTIFENTARLLGAKFEETFEDD